jgi:signal transduction histidine kinase/ActR/RegA family two-component response regulator
MKEDNNLSFLAFLDDDGYYYTTSGTYPFASKISSIGSLLAGEDLISYDETILGDNMLLLGTKIRTVSYGKKKFFAVLAGLSASGLTNLLSISDENVQVHTNIFSNNGNLIAKCGHSEELFVGSNWYSWLRKNGQFDDGYTLEKIQQDIYRNQEGLVMCTVDGEYEYIFYAPIPETEWIITTSISYEVMAKTISSFANTLTKNAVIVMCVVVVVLFVIFLFYYLGMSKASVAMNDALEQAKKANQAKSEFLSSMSHDIRTPLNAVMGMTGIALKHTGEEERVKDCLEKIEESSNHLLRLINDVLDMSRIESGKIVIAKEPFDLRTCLANCASIIEGQLATREVKLIREFEEFEYPMVLGDELHLSQIFINILGNSVKFTPDGGKIYFRARQIEKEGKTVFYFELEDTGIGMKPEFLPQLFEKFTQESSGSRTNYKGTGLGMAITKQFVDLMNGTINVESTLNVGTKFMIEIPMEIDTERKTELVIGEESFDLDGMKILLVEDNELNMEIAEELLEEQGVFVTTATNGQFGLNVFEQSKIGTFDAILMDIMMPVMDGLTATKKIRQLNRADAKTIPIIAMTANAYAEDIQKTKDAGMNTHLSKPINVDMLYATLMNFYKN